jgi:hypothetical protein
MNQGNGEPINVIKSFSEERTELISNPKNEGI